MNRLYVLGLLFAMSFVSSVPRAHAESPHNIILSEIAWAGSAQSSADEWIELANQSAEPVPLGGWQLTGVGTGGTAITIPAETLLHAGSTYLISNYALSDPKSTLNVPSDLVSTTVSIPNTALNITLIDPTGAVVDSLVDPGTPDAGSSATFSSMERVPTDLSWATAETSTNLLNGQYGSPGVVGHGVAAPEESAATEEAITEPNTPVVPEPVTDSAPIAIQTPVEPPTEPVVAPAPTDEVATAIASDPTPEVPADIALIEPVVTPEPVEIAEPTIIETPVVVAETPIVVAVVVEPVPIETLPALIEPTVSEPIETTASTAPVMTEPEIDPAPSTIRVGDLVISGVYPSPNTGDDEWVALTNATSTAIDLTGITIVDGSGTVTALGNTIEAQTTIYILNPKGKLNNDGDRISIVDRAGTIIDAAAYGTDEFPAPKKGTPLLFSSASIAPEPIDAPASLPYEEPLDTITTVTDTAVTTSATTATSADLTTRPSGARTSRSVALATTSTSIPSTHSAPNIATRVTTTATKATTKSASTRSSTSRASVTAPRTVSINDIAALADDTTVTLEGIVVSTPGTIGKRSFFLDGLEIYQSQGDLATLSVGDHVRITGTVSVLSDHRRVNIKAGGATVLGASSPVIHDYAESLPYGSLVRVTGTVSARDGNAVVLRIDDTRSITITPAVGVTVQWADLAGKTLTVTGVLKNSSTPVSIVLRNAEDITVAQEPAEAEAAIAGTSSSTNIPWVGVSAAALVAAGFGAWIWRNRPQSSLTKLTLHPHSV
jgi:hypothetical protein